MSWRYVCGQTGQKGKNDLVLSACMTLTSGSQLRMGPTSAQLVVCATCPALLFMRVLCAQHIYGLNVHLPRDLDRRLCHVAVGAAHEAERCQ
jgi:hypothetical protein